VPLCPHDDVVYREPTPLERAFLALVTRAHPGFATATIPLAGVSRASRTQMSRRCATTPTLRRNRPNEKPIDIETTGSIESGPYALFLEAERFGEIVEPGSAA